MVHLVRSLWSLLLLPAALALSNEEPVADAHLSTPTSRSTYTLYHRIYNPIAEASSWSTRGRVSIASDGTSGWEAEVREELSSKDSREDAWYQVALGSEGEDEDASNPRFGMSSVRLVSCLSGCVYDGPYTR
jgi:hypothetical protein